MKREQVAMDIYQHIRRIAKGDKAIEAEMIERVSRESGLAQRMWACEMRMWQGDVWAQDAREIGYDASNLVPPPCECRSSTPDSAVNLSTSLGAAK